MDALVAVVEYPLLTRLNVICSIHEVSRDLVLDELALCENAEDLASLGA